MPPPPPPPPPPAPQPSMRSSSHGRSQFTTSRQRNEDNPYEADLQQSTVEYPEKQSVSSLRSTIEKKINGSGPRRGSLTGGPTVASSADKVRGFYFLCCVLYWFMLFLQMDDVSKKEHDYQLPVMQQKPFASGDLFENGIASTRSERQVYYSSYASSRETRRKEETSAYNVSKNVSREQPQHQALENLKMETTTWKKSDDFVSPPLRPVPPSNLLSPVPPPRPPTPLEYKSKTQPSRPDNFARPYDSSSFRGIYIRVTEKMLRRKTKTALFHLHQMEPLL